MKIEAEYNKFLDELEKKEPKEIIAASYEKVFKEDIMMALSNIDLPYDSAKALLYMEYPLAAAYEAWMDRDVTYMEELRECLEEFAKEAINMEQEIKFEILEHIGVLSEEPSGWRKELNLIRWNGGEPRYDCRSWNEDHTQMTRGLTLSEGEIRKLIDHWNIRRKRGRHLDDKIAKANEQQAHQLPNEEKGMEDIER